MDEADALCAAATPAAAAVAAAGVRQGACSCRLQEAAPGRAALKTAWERGRGATRNVKCVSYRGCTVACSQWLVGWRVPGNVPTPQLPLVPRCSVCRLAPTATALALTFT